MTVQGEIAAHEAGAILREEVAQYFDRGTLPQRDRTATIVIRIASIVLGLAMVLVALAATWVELRGTGEPPPIDEKLVARLMAQIKIHRDLLLPGFMLFVLGVVPYLWRTGWLLPAVVAALVLLAEYFYFQLGNDRLTIGLLVAALGAVVLGARRVLGGRQPPDLEQLEEKLDDWIAGDIKRQLAEGEKQLPFALDLGGPEWRVLRCVPERTRSGLPVIARRVSRKDKRLRITPTGVAAFGLKPDGLIVYEATAELRSGKLLHSRVHEFAYSDIVAIHWTSDTITDDQRPSGAPVDGAAAPPSASDAAAKPGPAPAAPARSAVQMPNPWPRPRSPHRLDCLELRLVGGTTVTVTFCDSRLLPAGASASPSIEQPAKIRATVGEIRERWVKARATRRGAPA